jgi:hypothetical protein
VEPYTQQVLLHVVACLDVCTQWLLQGNPRIVKHLQSTLNRHGRSHITVLLSEVRVTANDTAKAAACLDARAV